jgi:hypothetical protein
MGPGDYVLNQEPALNLAQEPSFLESCLPGTMPLASRHRHKVMPLLPAATGLWPFEDLILVWLADHWREDVTKYHAKQSGSMSERFGRHQLERLDDHYLAKLRDRLRSIGGRPGLKALSTRNANHVALLDAIYFDHHEDIE